MASIKPEPPAKVNLVLDVLARRADGFHDIESLVITVGLRDRMTVETCAGGTIDVSCDDPSVPIDGRNLVVQAAERLQKRLEHAAGCRIRLVKRIPVGGGLGGGSSDAAAALVALNTLWECGLSAGELAEIGATIGSDVPFFFSQPSAILFGRGDCVRPVRLNWQGWIVLVLAGVHVSTVEVYRHCRPGPRESPTNTIGVLRDAPVAHAIRPHLRNALEEAVFCVAPQVKRMRDAVAGLTGRTLTVSGAGSVLFDIFDEKSDAQAFVEQVRGCPLVHAAVVAEAPAGRV